MFTRPTLLIPETPGIPPGDRTVPTLSQREVMACIDDAGRVRCPWCKRFARLSDMTRTPAECGPGYRVSLSPRCRRCAGEGAPR